MAETMTMEYWMSLIPSLRAMGYMSGAISTMAGSPSRIQPSTRKTMMETAMKPIQPPGSAAMKFARSWAMPAWVMAQAMATAQARIMRMAP